MYFNLVKKVHATQSTDTRNLANKADYKSKVGGIKKKTLGHDHGKFITTVEFNKLTTNNLETTLAQANLEAKADTDDLVEETDFDDTLKNLNKKLNSNKTRHAEAVRKLTDITEKSKQMSEKNI